MALSSTRTVTARRALALPLVGTVAVGVWVDVLAVASLLALAGAVRWPHLLLSPQFPSVGDTILMALDVADGRAFYLRDSAPYLGAPFLWLLALVYRLFGPSLEATMLVAWTIGTLTLVPTYLLGRAVGGRGVGLIGGTFLATSGAHTVVSSHVPLSHSLTPLVATTTLWLLAWAANRASDGPDAASLARGGRLLALAGLLAGLTLQTHPTAAPLLAGAVLGVVLGRPGWLRTRWPVLALALVVAGYSTLLIYHVTSRFEIVADIQSKQARYLDADEDAGEEADHGVYANNLEQLLLSTARLLSGAIGERESAGDFLADPWVLAPSILALAGLALAIRERRTWWVVSAVALAVVLPPALSGKYRPILDGRYLMPLAPLLFVASALAIATLARAVARAGAPSASLSGRDGLGDRTGVAAAGAGLPLRLARGAGLAGLVVGTTFLAAHPVELLERFYEESQEDGFSNALYLRTLRQIAAARHGDEAVLLDPRLATVKSAGGGKASTSFDFLLALERIPTERLDAAAFPASLTGRLAILHRATADHLDDSLPLEPLDGKRQQGKDSPSYRAYRIGERAAASR